MAQSAGLPHPRTAGELKELLASEKRAHPFLICRDENARQLLYALPDADVVISIGRRAQNNLAIDWDPEVSRVHAELRRVGGEWAVGDQGLSRNGTFLRGERVSGWRRLRDGDGLRVGDTLILFRDPRSSTESNAETVGRRAPLLPELTPTQRRILIALCRPLAKGGFVVPASNADVAAEVSLSQDRVKGHLRDLFRKLGLADLPQNHKRAALVELALHEGLVTGEELDCEPEPR